MVHVSYLVPCFGLYFSPFFFAFPAVRRGIFFLSENHSFTRHYLFAFWTFAIDVRLAVAPFVFLQAEYIFHAIGKIHINAVFLLPRVKIA